MLIAILLLLYAFGVSYIAGHSCICFIRRIMHVESRAYPITTLLNIIGLAGLSIIVSIYHFFSAIDIFLHIGIFLCLVGYIFFNRVDFLSDIKEFGKHIRENKWLALSLVIVAVISIISRPGTGDIADYHLQAIKWAEHFPNIIGLGNYNRPLANNNWWFNLQAFFGLSFLGTQSVYILNALFFICTTLYFFDSSSAYSSAVFRIPVLLFLALSIKTAFIGSVTPDFIITCIIFLSIDIYISYMNREANNVFYYYVLLILIMWAITIKMVALILLLLLLPTLLIFKKDWHKKITVSVLISFLFIIPWLIGNIIVCGYLLYPFNNIDLFNVDWKVPGFYFEFDRIVLQGWGRVSDENVFLSSQYPYSKWIPIWFGKLDLFNRGVVILFGCSIPVLLYQLRKVRNYIIPVVILLLGFTLLFISGPHPRFLFGYYVSIIGLTLASILPKNSRPFPKWLFSMIIIVLSLIVLKVTYNQSKLPLSSLIKPVGYPASDLKKKIIGGKTFYLPINGNGPCWDQFPCSPYFIYNIELRGEEITDGFRVFH